MELTELVARLRAWSRRYEPRSPERVLFLESAATLEQMEQQAAEAGSGEVTVEAVEKAIGSPLLPWQKKRLEERRTPPASDAA